jgi:hypothetical protein
MTQILDASPIVDAHLPFPAPPFDHDKAWAQIVELRTAIRRLVMEMLLADEAKVQATKTAKAAHDALDQAHAELDALIDRVEQARSAAQAAHNGGGGDALDPRD